MPTALGSGVISFVAAAGATTHNLALTIAATGSNRALVVGAFIYSGSGAASITGVTYNSVAMTAAAAGYGTITDTGTLRYWGLVNPGTGSSFNIGVTIAGGTAEELIICGQAFTDVDQTTPFGTQVGTNGTNSTTSTGTVSISGSDLALAMWSGYDAASAVTLTPNGTGIVEDENDQFTGTSFGFQYRANGTLGWTMSPAVDSFQQLSIPLKHAGGGGGGGIMRPAGGVGTGGMQSLGGGMQGKAHGRGRIVVPANYFAHGNRGARNSLRI
jgi:hypothetical protein